MNDSTESNQLIERANAGDEIAFNELIDRHRDYLCRVIDLRMEPAIRGRLDASDIVQETQLLARQRFGEFSDRRSTSFRLWLRGHAVERLMDERRRHYAKKRSVKREVYLSDASSMTIAQRLVTGTPSKAVIRRELVDQVRSTMFEMKEADRECLLLRYVEGLSNVEVAELLGIEPDTASRRHGRAIRRLCQMLAKQGLLENE